MVLLSGVVACGGGDTGTATLSVRLTSGYGASLKDERYTLRCHPMGGDMPNRVRLCAMIASHPRAMLRPARARSTCLGGPGRPPSVSVSGKWNGRRVRFEAQVMCDWPGGVAALAYWAAAESPHDLPVAAVRLRCDDDSSLQRKPIRWARVRACLRALPPHWHPS
jgi:Subtilisin inhibitor-like